MVSITTAGAIKLEHLPAVGKGAYGFYAGSRQVRLHRLRSRRVPASPPPSCGNVTPMTRSSDYLAFFRGALLGIAMLLTVALFALYGFRARAVFLAAGGFALCLRRLHGA